MTIELQVVDLLEGGKAFIPGIVLSARDQRLAKSLKGVDIHEVRDGVSISASSWVGVVRFEAFTLRISPKLTNIDIVRMLLVAGGLDRLRRYHATRGYELQDAVSLFDLLALLFADACVMIVRDGLLRGYVAEEDDLPVIRGRLRVADQIRRRFGQVNRLECLFDDHHADIIENRILLTALMQCHRHVRHPVVRRRVHQLVDTFAAACSPLHEPWRDARTELTYNRLNGRYQEAHTLAWTLLEGMGTQDILASGNTRGFVFLLDMNPLFERFVEVLVRSVFRDEPITIYAQVMSGSHIWDVERNEAYKRIRPDLLITTNAGSQLAIDAKYKRYDTRKLDESDIYQAFLYAHAFGSVGDIIPAALIFYPADDTRQLTQLHIRDRHGRIRARLHACGIDIPHLLRGLIDSKGDHTREALHDIHSTIQSLLA